MASYGSSSNHSSSFSSLSSLSSDSSLSSRDESSIFSPKSPLPSTRVPFSWEKLPGIPKKQSSRRIDKSLNNLLPLPPAAGIQYPHRILNSREDLVKKYDGESFRKDPFFAALVECSKDRDRINEQYHPSLGKLSKITRGLSEGFALMSISNSCKSDRAMSDSMVYVPRSRKHSNVLVGSRPTSKSNTFLF